MTWHQTEVYQERIKLIDDWLAGEFCSSALCQCYPIIQRTGYKLYRSLQTRRERIRSLSRLSIWWLKLGILTELQAVLLVTHEKIRRYFRHVEAFLSQNQAHVV